MRLKLGVLVCMLFLSASISLLGNPTETAASASQDLISQEEAFALNAVNQQVIPPTKKRKMIKWLKAGTYKKQFLPEPQVVPSVGPHGGNVRTYYNPILVEDLRAGLTKWRAGASMVKELYLGGKDQVKGYAVMIKVNEESGKNGEGWIFYEAFDINSPGSGFYGRGVGICANCHKGGLDYLLATFRP